MEGKTTELRVALGLGWHIDNPCSNPVTGETFRPMYIRLAKYAIKDFTNPYFKQFLEEKINKYDSGFK